MKCLCCDRPLSDAHRRQNGSGHGVNKIPDYCDGICYAAHTTLTEAALIFWRASCWRLDLNPVRAST